MQVAFQFGKHRRAGRTFAADEGRRVEESTVIDALLGDSGREGQARGSASAGGGLLGAVSGGVQR